MKLRPPRRRAAPIVLATLLLAICTLIGGVPAPASAQAASTQAASVAASPQLVSSCDQSPPVGTFACYATRLAAAGVTSRHTLAVTDATPSGYGPTQLQAAYALTAAAGSGGSGQRVYVVDAYDDPSAESDLAVYRAQYGLGECTTADGCFRKINQDGNAAPLPDTDAGWSAEIALDLDMVSAICPGCDITLVEADDAEDGLLYAVQEATALGASFVSMSWGATEDPSESSLDPLFSTPGVVYTAATGDDTYAGGIGYPATSPDVVAVGGTSLSRSSTTPRGWTERAWMGGSRGAGSGCSAYEPAPAWQSVLPAGTCAAGRRAVADVSADADPQTGVAVYNTTVKAAAHGGWAVYGGTSASTPIIAATYALAGTPDPSEAPAHLLYDNSAHLNDVTTGSTGTCTPSLLCTAEVGWDGPTGLGTPNGLRAFAPAGTAGTGGTGDNAGAGDTVTVVDPGPQSAIVGSATSLHIDSTDADGATLGYRATGVPDGLSLDPATGEISGTPQDAGTYQVEVTASDNSGASAAVDFTWTIAAAPRRCTGNVITDPGFESGPGAWSMSSRLTHLGADRAHRGKHFARFDGYGRVHTDSLWRRISVPAGCSATLHYFVRTVTTDRTGRAHDRFVLRVASAVRSTMSNLSAGGYREHTVDLSRYAGRSVTVGFTGTENSSRATAFFLDDVTLDLS